MPPAAAPSRRWLARLPWLHSRLHAPQQRSRLLTQREIALARTVFGEAIDYAAVRVHARKFWFGQPRRMAIAPNGHIHFHPAGHLADFACAAIGKQAWFVHEMTHVWQHQQGVSVWRAVFDRRYDYAPLVPGRAFDRYGLEQQAEIVADYFRLLHGCRPQWGAHAIEDYRALLPFDAHRS